MLAIGLFAAPELLNHVYVHRNPDYAGFFYTFADGNSPNARLLGMQMLGMLFITGWVAVIMVPFFVFLDLMGWFRSDPLEEIVGLDTTYHGGLALLTDQDVNPEYISAYKQRIEERKATGRYIPGTSLHRVQFLQGASAEFSDTNASVSAAGDPGRAQKNDVMPARSESKSQEEESSDSGDDAY
jgi:Ammonium Transporter Family